MPGSVEVRNAGQGPSFSLTPEGNHVMGKLITMWVVLARREGRFVTEEDAARQRGLNDWWRNWFNPQWVADLGKPSKPPVQPGSKVQLKVVWRHPC
jgi:hypothetical protein